MKGTDSGRGDGLRAALVLGLLAALAGCGAPEAGPSGSRLRLATTTSTDSSGLLRDVLPPFERETGIRVDVLAVGTGQALALGEQGEADLLLVHAREREDAFMAAGHGLERRDVMWNDFVILGPPADPAGVAGGTDAAAALARIAAAGEEFVSRGDDSGTHIRERRLWRDAGVEPGSWPGYLQAGQGMGPCLVMADEKQAYVLADRGTWLAYARRLDLALLVAGDPRLRNPYGAILVRPHRDPPGPGHHAARRLLDHLTSPEGQRRIGGFRVDGKVLFHPAAGAS